MKNQTLKKSTKKFEEREVVVKNKDEEGAISNKKCEGIIKNNNYGITLIALVITTIVHYVERLNAVISRVECI